MNSFELASRKKFRFNVKGVATTEDLWDLSVASLDNLFMELNKQAKEDQQESLLAKKTAKNEELEAKISIVKHIVLTKLEERDRAKKLKDNRELKQKILQIKAERADDALSKKNDSELDALLATLEV